MIKRSTIARLIVALGLLIGAVSLGNARENCFEDCLAKCCGDLPPGSCSCGVQCVLECGP